MGTYIHFTEEQKLRAASVDLEEFLQRRGEKLIRSGHDKRLESDHSVTVRGNEWYDHAAEKGGGPVSFVRRFYGLDFSEAVKMLLGGEHGEVYPAAQDRVEKPPKPFELPPQSKDMRRVYAYLTKSRGIDRQIISEFAKSGLLYEDAKYHNAVFVGRDEQGVARHAHVRSTNSQGKAFRMNVESSLPQYSFHYQGRTASAGILRPESVSKTPLGTTRPSDRLYVFEAPIDLLSFLTLYPKDWQRHSYVALCGVGGQAMWKMLELDPEIRKVALCLDNDEAGQKAEERLGAELREKDYETAVLVPEAKDWSEVITSSHQENELLPTMNM